jgi:hypothetical protein
MKKKCSILRLPLLKSCQVPPATGRLSGSEAQAACFVGGKARIHSFLGPARAHGSRFAPPFFFQVPYRCSVTTESIVLTRTQCTGQGQILLVP